MISRTLIILAALSLSACVSVLPEPEMPNGLYRLEPASHSASIGRTLVVREPEGARIFSGKEMASEGRDGALRLIRGVEWAQPASRMLQSGLLDSFGHEGGGLVLAKGTGAPGDIELAWRIKDLTLYEETARCKLELTLLDGRSRKPLHQENVEADASAASSKAEDRAQALKRAAQSCVSQSAEAISTFDASYTPTG